jgi:hypothetical protein
VSTEGHLPAKAALLANVVLAAAGSLCLLALAYFVYNYAWTGERHLTGLAAVFQYYVCPALLALLFFAALRLPESTKVRLALMACSTGISVYMLEIALTVWFNVPSVAQNTRLKILAASAKSQGLSFDTRSVQGVVSDLRRQGVDAIRSVYPQAQFEKPFADLWKSIVRAHGVETLPLSGISNKVTVFCNESGQYVTYTSDEHGFNNPPKLWNARIDIVAVGDSYVHGMCVPTTANLVSLIRQRYPGTLNLGMQGDGPLSMLATIKEYAEIVKPQMVLWFYFENDFIDLGIERTAPLLMRYLTPGFSQGIFSKQADIDRVLSDFLARAEERNAARTWWNEISTTVADLISKPGVSENVFKLIELRTRLGLPAGKTTIPPRVDTDEDRDLFYQILAEARRSVERWGGHLHFVFLPAWNRYAPGQVTWPGRDDVLQAAVRAGLPITDLHQAFITQKNPLALFPPAPYPNHYNEAGHRLVAEEVLRAISVAQ